MNQDNWGIWRGGIVNADDRGGAYTVWSLHQNDVFIVTVVGFWCLWGECIHMVIRMKSPSELVKATGEFHLPLDRGVTWTTKQQIKNDLVGASRVAVEVFPPAAELVDQADAYHLWVLPEGFKLPFGVEEA